MDFNELVESLNHTNDKLQTLETLANKLCFAQNEIFIEFNKNKTKIPPSVVELFDFYQKYVDKFEKN